MDDVLGAAERNNLCYEGGHLIIPDLDAKAPVRKYKGLKEVRAVKLEEPHRADQATAVKRAGWPDTLNPHQKLLERRGENVVVEMESGKLM